MRPGQGLGMAHGVNQDTQSQSTDQDLGKEQKVPDRRERALPPQLSDPGRALGCNRQGGPAPRLREEPSKGSTTWHGIANPVHSLGPELVVAPTQCLRPATPHSPSPQDTTPRGLCMSPAAAPFPVATLCRFSIGLPAHRRKTKSREGYQRRS